ncbi:MAG: hypothetical protein ACRD3T_01830 [Terriglobia bacterium]
MSSSHTARHGVKAQGQSWIGGADCGDGSWRLAPPSIRDYPMVLKMLVYASIIRTMGFYHLAPDGYALRLHMGRLSITSPSSVPVSYVRPTGP